jgi:anti-sigma factor RsiW
VIDEQPGGADLQCIQLVELLTAYLDDALPEPAHAAFDAHLAGCPGCRAALAQWRTVVELVGRLRPEDVASLDTYTRDRLLATLTTPRRR